MALLDPRLTDPDLTPVGDWMPARFTPSLTGDENFPTEGDRLLEFAAKHWRTPEVKEFLADPWQVWLLRHVLELYPADWDVPHLRGQLRFRQVVISMARQNGKSVLGALLAFYYLALHVRGSRVVGVASIARQARIVYDRVRYVVENNPAIDRELNATVTRGITRRDGTGIYQVLPNDEESAQGEPITGSVYDELHLGNAGLWDAIVLGQRSRRNSQLTGLTTAGDDDSLLLQRLYREGQAAIEGQDERFGFFVWESADDTLTEANVIAASPAIACGRIDLDTAMAEARKLWDAPADETGVLGRDRCIRYVLNRFVETSSAGWASLPAWADATTAEPPPSGAVTYGIDRAAGWEWATITANYNTDGILYSHVIAQLQDPDHDVLLEAAKRLAHLGGDPVFVLDRATLADLGKSLKDQGHTVHVLTTADTAAAAATAKAAISRRHLQHPGDPITRAQMRAARRRDTPEGWRLSRTLSTDDIDAVLAMVYGVHIAATRLARHRQLF